MSIGDSISETVAALGGTNCKMKQFGKITAILCISNVVYVIYELYKNTGTFDTETDYHVLLEDGQLRICNPLHIKKEQILYYEAEGYFIVNFHFK